MTTAPSPEMDLDRLKLTLQLNLDILRGYMDHYALDRIEVEMEGRDGAALLIGIETGSDDPLPALREGSPMRELLEESCRHHLALTRDGWEADVHVLARVRFPRFGDVTENVDEIPALVYENDRDEVDVEKGIDF